MVLFQVGFSSLSQQFLDLQIDGDLLLQLDNASLERDLNISNGITRARFLRELTSLKQSADYQSCDPSKLDDWLKEVNTGFKQYTYQMTQAGVDANLLKWLTNEHLQSDCRIQNGVHRLRILEAAKCK